jgi:hypothetical protein
MSTYEHKPLLDQSPELLCEELFVFYEALRRLGFTPDEIFLCNGVLYKDIVCFGLVVRVQGAPDYSCAIGTSTGSSSEVIRVWSKMNDTGQARGEALWRQRMPHDKFAALGGSIKAKGLPMRALEAFNRRKKN